MKIKITGSYGYIGSDFNYTEDIPEDIVVQGEYAIQDYIYEEYKGVLDDMCQRLSLSITLAEE